MQIFVKLPNSGTLSIDVKSTDSVEELRATVYAKYAGAHPDLQTLAFQGRVLEDGKTLADYGLALESELQLGVRPASQTIELCVGGRDYITTLDTLL
jgi:large subunit ribosomal protein L40e